MTMLAAMKPEIAVFALVLAFLVGMALLCATAANADDVPPDLWDDVLARNDLSWRVLEERAARLAGRQKEIADTVVRFAGVAKTRANLEDSLPAMRDALGWREDAQLGMMFRQDHGLYPAVSALIGENKTELARILWNRADRFPYAHHGRKHPAFRSLRFGELHIDDSIETLGRYVAALAEGFVADDLIGKGLNRQSALVLMPHFDRAPIYGLLLSFSRRRDELLAWMEGEIRLRIAGPLDENGEVRSITDLVRGLLASDAPKPHQTVKRLLLDRRLPESARAEIIDCADQGTKAAFATLLEAMEKNAIVRFASIRHAYCRWLGLNGDAAGADTVGVGITVTRQCLTGAASRDKCLSAPDDPFLTYQALWGMGMNGVEAALDACKDIAAGGTRSQKIAALYFGSKLHDLIPKAMIAAAFLANPADRDDPVLTALAVACLRPPRDTGDWLQLNELPTGEEAGKRTNLWTFSREEARGLYASLKDVADRFPPDGPVDRGGRIDVGGEFAVAYTLDDVFAIMTHLLGREWAKAEGCACVSPEVETWGVQADLDRTPPTPLVLDALDDDAEETNLREDLCRYFPRMGVEAREVLIKSVVRNGGGGPGQRAVLVRSFADNPRQAWRYASHLELTDAECRTLEEALANAGGEARAVIFLKLLGRDPAGLGVSVKRLLADRGEAGRELLGIMERKKDDPRYRETYRECREAAAQ